MCGKFVERCDVAYFNLLVGLYVKMKGCSRIRSMLCEICGCRFGTDEDSGFVGCYVVATDR
jgi:hypothetical protein